MRAIGKDLLPKSEASKELGIHPRTLNRYVREGRIASVRHAGSTYISRRAIEDYWDRLERAGDLKRTAAEKQARRRGGDAA